MTRLTWADLDLADGSVGDLVQEVVVFEVEDLVGVLLGVVSEHLSIDVVKLNKAWPLEALFLEERHSPLLRLSPANEFQWGGPALEGRVVVRGVDADGDERVVVLVVEKASHDFVLLGVEVAQALPSFPAEGDTNPGMGESEDHALGSHLHGTRHARRGRERGGGRGRESQPLMIDDGVAEGALTLYSRFRQPCSAS